MNASGACAVRRGTLEESKQLSNVVSELRVVTHRGLRVDLVVVATPDALPADVVRLDEVGHDSLSGSLGDADRLRDVSHANVSVSSDAEQHLRVVGQEPPVSFLNA
jgi:hypothetical protein